ncbi:uncharacterized protein DEA37_0009391 [Paragonimus westermani]|uniref:Reverse transcriptase domain-containing protein n=1 Tax=Paragonimus westermani TaxID=34504 RepID=A0A5J4N5Q3_9TREM|nr:uncharacterized protein DEA37_0009391 [Paragonimus westermani]
MRHTRLFPFQQLVTKVSSDAFTEHTAVSSSSPTTPPEKHVGAENIQSDVTEPTITKAATKEEDTEISVEDLTQIETAIAESSNALNEEAIHGLKRGSRTLTGNQQDYVNEIHTVETPVCTAPWLQSTVEKYTEIFTDENDPYGFCNWIAHEIPTTEIFRPQEPLRIPVLIEEDVKRHIRNVLDEDVIEEANSPYNLPVLLVKFNGKYRFCVDFRRLNEVT